MNVLPLSQAVGRAVAIEWWQTGETAPIDCTGFTCQVADTSLPFPPSTAPATTLTNAIAPLVRMKVAA